MPFRVLYPNLYNAKSCIRYRPDQYHISLKVRALFGGVERKIKMFSYLKLIFTVMKNFFVDNNTKRDIEGDVTIESGRKLAEKKVNGHT